METFMSFEEFLVGSRANIPVMWFVISLLLTAILALLLSWIYVKYGTALSNRRLFAKNFLILTMTTMLIITIVKSSLALSLGLVGALSIVRFRAAIKEPEELAYLFLAIAIGLGFGANQGVITIIAFFIITMMLVAVRTFVSKPEENLNLHVAISSQKPNESVIDKVVETLKDHCSVVRLRRIDETAEMFEASFIVDFKDYEQLNETKKALIKLDGNLKFSFLDSKGIY